MRPEENILFKGINKTDCENMMKCFNPDIKRYKAGSRIVTLSECSENIGIVLRGSAIMVRYDINGVRTIIENIETQGIFGELISHGLKRDSIEIVCEKDCEIMFVRKSEILKRCENACRCHSMVVENLLELMSEKAQTLSERIEVLSQRSIRERLISYLQIISDKTPEGVTPQIPFSTTALSDYLCVNRSALQREMTKLKSSGVLAFSKRKFKFLRNPDEEN